MSEPKTKFQQLLQELFQFDLADLDFGIYRIMNYKRQVIERWITEDLPRAIGQELQQGALAEQAEAQKALSEALQKVKENLGPNAIDAEGNLDERFKETKVGKEYLEARAKAAHAQSNAALEAAVYNHLYTFFSRYYQDGDFISKRRYSKKERYAIPYNGEEIYLYWANHDQYYVKTAEHFTDYAWKAPNGVTVHFKLKAADVEQNNVKGEKRFFLPVLDDIAWQEATRTLTIPFEYRPLTRQEEKTYGAKNQQDAIIADTVKWFTQNHKDIKNSLFVSSCLSVRTQDAKGNAVSHLEHHLRQYTARNTRDFFIHKDLKGFLSRELDFYLKNEVLNLDEMEAAGEGLAEGWFQLMRLIKRVGNHIIDFLAQIEDFQKALWEKKKFVTETFYMVTVGNLPPELYGEIAECEAQWDEWQALGMVSEGLTQRHRDTEKNLGVSVSPCEERLAFLTSHPSLPLDTRHFPQDFTDCLLATFANLDDATDGLLVHSENWQALNLLQEKYRGQVKCIYIDPPFNSPATEILYKNNYKHSSWLSLIGMRIDLSQSLLPDGVYVIAIDENEQERLGLLLENTWLSEWKKACIAIRHNPRGIQGKNVSYCHEYAYFLYPSDEKKYIGDRLLEELDIRNLRDSGTESDRNDAKNCFYPFIVQNGKIIGVGEVPSDDYHPKGVNEKASDGRIYVWPVDTFGREKKWRYANQSVKTILQKLEVREVKGKYEIYFAKDFGTVRTLWTESQFDASEYGTKLLQEIFGRRDIDFSYPKSLYTLVETIRVTIPQNGENLVLDYFAGSGTTGHAVINLNREDGGRRKFILVEMADYFDTVLLPRLKKVTFSPEWKDGKPQRPATQEEFELGPRLVKVIRLESYEDALNNIAFDEESGQTALDLFGEEYLLRYMLRWESRQSATLLDVEKLQTPFSYQLHIHRDGETCLQPVDLPETFNYLIGLDVETRKVFTRRRRDTEEHLGVSVSPGEVRYLLYRGTLRNGRKAAILWRETKDWTQADYEWEAVFVAEHQLTDGADEIFVNGDSVIPGAQSLDGLFKARLFGGTEA